MAVSKGKALVQQRDALKHSLTEKSNDLDMCWQELQAKTAALHEAEQSDMLEQSLLERNHLIQRWEGVLDSVEMPASVKSLEPEDRIEWLGRALNQAH